MATEIPVTPKYPFSTLQRSGVKRWQQLCGEIRLANEHYDVMCKAGLEREARKKILPTINALVAKRDALERELNARHEKIARGLLAVFAACDIATIAVDKFHDAIVEGEATSADDALVGLIKDMADRWNEMVQIIDEGGCEQLSLYYADMAEEISDAVFPTIMEIIEKHQHTDVGKKLF